MHTSKHALLHCSLFPLIHTLLHCSLFSFKHTLLHCSLFPFKHTFLHCSLFPFKHTLLQCSLFPLIHALLHYYFHSYIHFCTLQYFHNDCKENLKKKRSWLTVVVVVPVTGSVMSRETVPSEFRVSATPGSVLARQVASQICSGSVKELHIQLHTQGHRCQDKQWAPWKRWPNTMSTMKKMTKHNEHHEKDDQTNRKTNKTPPFPLTLVGYTSTHSALLSG